MFKFALTSHRFSREKDVHFIFYTLLTKVNFKNGTNRKRVMSQTTATVCVIAQPALASITANSFMCVIQTGDRKSVV